MNQHTKKKTAKRTTTKTADPRTCIGVGPGDTRIPVAGTTEEALAYAATLPRRPTDQEALLAIAGEADELLEDYRTVEAALLGGVVDDYGTSVGPTLKRCTDRLQGLLDRLSDARGGQVVDDGEGQVTS